MRRRLHKIWLYVIRWFLQPIHFYVFHNVSDKYDELLCGIDDWTQTEQFKQNIEKLSQQYTFISLSEAYNKLQHDWFRIRNYAVLTTDDGLASVLNVIPWLEERKIPLTLFINTRYWQQNKLKPIHLERLQKITPNADILKIAKQLYMSREQIWALDSPFIEIGLHGHEHLDAKAIKEQDFELNVEQCIEKLAFHPRYVPFYAYPWGMGTQKSKEYLISKGIVPVMVDNDVNCVWTGSISRVCIDHKVL